MAFGEEVDCSLCKFHHSGTVPLQEIHRDVIDNQHCAIFAKHAVIFTNVRVIYLSVVIKKGYEKLCETLETTS